MHNIQELFAKFSKMKVGVIGDVMLDTYWWGRADRISPEAPVPVVTVNTKEKRIGGAGNVALNLVSLGASVSLLSMIGDDQDGQELVELLAKQKINHGYLLRSNNRITTNKIRIISRNQQMMRLDAEITKQLEHDDEESMMKAVQDYLEKERPDIVILEDYNKGVLTEQLIKHTLEICRRKNILVSVDPKRKNFFAFQYADIFKPNLHEVKEALNIIEEKITPEFLNQIHDDLKTKLHHQISLITLSEKGVFFHDQHSGEIIPTHVRSVADVSGAGDTVIAVASLVYAATRDVRLMAQISNIAGGLVCEEVGTAAINAKRLLQECEILLS